MPIKSDINLDVVRQIDVVRMPTLAIDVFCAFLLLENGETVRVCDDEQEFQNLQRRIFDRWPEIEPIWSRVYTGSPETEERVTVWQRREAY